VQNNKASRAHARQQQKVADWLK